VTRSQDKSRLTNRATRTPTTGLPGHHVPAGPASCLRRRRSRPGVPVPSLPREGVGGDGVRSRDRHRARYATGGPRGSGTATREQSLRATRPGLSPGPTPTPPRPRLPRLAAVLVVGEDVGGRLVPGKRVVAAGDGASWRIVKALRPPFFLPRAVQSGGRRRHSGGPPAVRYQRLAHHRQLRQVHHQGPTLLAVSPEADLSEYGKFSRQRPSEEIEPAPTVRGNIHAILGIEKWYGIGPGGPDDRLRRGRPP
jgi:hypothetical protein